MLGVDDVSLPSGDAPLTDGMDVQVVRNGVGEVVETRAAPPPVQKIDDPSLPRGKEVVVNPGKPGVSSAIMKIYVQNGQEVRRQQIGAGAMTAAVPRVIRIGTNDETPLPHPPSTTAASGTASRSARPPATGASAPATATTAACSSTRARGGRSAARPTRRCPARPAARSRSRSRRRCATPTVAATAHGPPARASSACPSDGRPDGGVHASDVTVGEARLLGPVEVRALAAELDLRPTKRLGQNFVHDANTVRRIVRAAELRPDDVVLEVGPGLGSLTLALLPEVAAVHAVEIDPVLAARLPATVADRAPALADRLSVHAADALRLRAADLTADRDRAPTGPPTGPLTGARPRCATVPRPGRRPGRRPPPTALVANLPYNVAVPVVLHLLAELPGIRRGLVMVQAEVAERLAAAPGSRVYGVPSAKLAWFAAARRAGSVPRSVFWPVPGVDSGLLAFDRREPPPGERAAVFAVVDAAFAQRRKALRSALAGWAGSPPRPKPPCARRASTPAPARRRWRSPTSPGSRTRCAARP